jgi:hypothetical protein
MADRQELPPWGYEFSDSRVPCLMCRERERTTIVGSRPDVGICEACAVHLYWSWRKLVPDAEPGPEESRGRVERVKVVLSRLKTLPDGKRADPEVSESYELALAFRPDGGLDFSSVDLRKGEGCVDAAVRALRQHGVHTWPRFVEPLYAALSPRGRLARVMLATAHTTWLPDQRGGVTTAPAPEGYLQWRDFGSWDETGMSDLRALYQGLRDVWPLRIWKYVAQEPRPAEITTCVRRAAAEYIYMQQDLRSGKKDVDTSAAELLRRGMSDDEVRVAGLLGEQERNLAELIEQEGPAPGDEGGDLADVDPSDLVPGEISPDGVDLADGEDDPFAADKD